MRHSFSAQFLKISPPATSFGEAWEYLCLRLLRADSLDNTIMRLGPPDRGIDILRQSTHAAYQCKSSEQGVFGTIDPRDCISSLERAIDAQRDISWQHYAIALNAPLSGVGFSKISDFAKSRGLQESALSVLSPEYWDQLCERHTEAIKHMFDYQVFVSEAEVIEALKKARYYDEIVQRATQQIRAEPLNLMISNNRTPVELTIPFSGEMTVKQLLDVARTVMGISLDWANFPDLDTSCGPSLSVTVDRVPQPFRRKLSELTPEQRGKLQLWIQLIWRDKLETKEEHSDGSKLMLLRSILLDSSRMRPALERDRGRVTLNRMEAIIQTTIWQSLMTRAPLCFHLSSSTN